MTEKGSVVWRGGVSECRGSAWGYTFEMRLLQKICTWVCIVCVALAVPLVLIMLWTGGWNDRAGLYLKTLAVFFVAGALVLSILRMVLPPSGRAG